jgi:hypothetical protein
VHGFQPDTVNGAERLRVMSPFCETTFAVAVPLDVWQVVANAPLAPPLSTTWSWVSGMSGMPVNDVVLVARLTDPVNVSENGAGNTSASSSPDEFPVR